MSRKVRGHLWGGSLSLALFLALAPTGVSVAQPSDDDEEGDEASDDDAEDTPDALEADDDDEASGEDGSQEAEKKKAKDKKAKKKKAKKKKKNKSDVRVRGRVFVRNTSTKTVIGGAQWRNDFAVSSARANLDVRKYGWLQGSLEVEFSDDDLELKDVYLRAEVYPQLSVQVGNFKRPISPIATAGLWDLPFIERGILADRVVTANYLVPLNLGGRSSGVMLTYDSEDGVRPRVDVGLFNARLPRRSGDGAELEDSADNLLRDVYLRTQIEPIAGFTVGGTLVAFTQARFADDLRTRVLGSLDVSLDTPYFRAWLEGFAGRTPFFDGTESVGGLLALRVLAAGKLREPTSWIRRLEPFVVFSALDPTDERQDNQSQEIGTGVAAYLRNNFRLQIEYTRTLNDDEFPQPAFAILDRHVIRLQAGARFR